EVAQVALGVDGERRDAVDGSLLEQPDAEPGLAAPCHPDADPVGRQVFRVVEQELGKGLPGLRVPAPPQVEDPELLVVRHWPSSCCQPTLQCRPGGLSNGKEPPWPPTTL